MVTPIPAVQTAPQSAEAPGSLTLKPGTEVPAKVEAALPNNVLRLSTPSGDIEVRASTPLPAGTAVTVKVSGEAARPQVQLIPAAPGKSMPQSLAQSPAPAPAQSQPAAQPTGQPSPPTAAGLAANTTAPAPQPAPPGLPAAAQLPPAKGQAPIVQAPQNSPLGQAPVPRLPVAQGVQVAQLASQTALQAPAAPQQAPQAAVPVTGSQPVPPASLPVASQALPGTLAPPASAQPAPAQPTSGPTAISPQGASPAGLVSNPGQGQFLGNQPAFAAQQPLPAGAAQAGGAQAGAQGTTASPPPAAAVPGAASAVSPTNIAGPGPLPASGALPQTPVPPVQAQIPAPGSPGAMTVQTGPAAANQGAGSQPAAAGHGTSVQTPAVNPQQAGGSQPTPNTSPAVQASPRPAAQPLPGAPVQTGAVPQGAVPQGSSNVTTPGTSTPAGGLTPSAAAGNSGPGTVPASGVAPSAPPVAGAPASAVSPPPGPGRPTAPVTAQVSAPNPPPGPVPGAGQPASTTASSRPAATLPISAPLVKAAEAVTPKLQDQQTSLAGAFAQITALNSRSALGMSKVPEPVQRVMQQLLGLQVSGDGPVTGDTVQKAVQQSGVFREAQVKRLVQSLSKGGGQSGPQGGAGTLTNAQLQGLGDLKSLLTQLKSLLRDMGVDPSSHKPLTQPPVPSTVSLPKGQRGALSSIASADVDEAEMLSRLMKDTDSALARLRLSQLASRGLMSDEGAQVTAKPMDVVLEVPITLGQENGVLQMQIGRDRDHAAEEDETDGGWRLRFGLDLASTGAVEAAVSLRGGSTFVSLWIDRAETYTQLSDQRETVQAAFADAGLDLRELRLLRGLPQKTRAGYGPQVDRRS